MDIDEIGELADKADNLIAATNIPLRPEMHVSCLKDGLKEISEALKQYYIEQTGENPWAD